VRSHARLAIAGAAAAAAIVGLLLAMLISSAGADSTPGQTVVLGSVTGNPTATRCAATVRCTYIAFNGIQFMIAPFSGTITSFSVNSGTAGGKVELRVLSSTSPPEFLNDEWTGAGTGPAETLKAGINTFPVNISVTQGDTIALDDDSGSAIFDNSSPAAQYASVAEYAPALPDGVTAYANRAQNALSLLMSATVVSGTPTSTSTTTTSTTTTTPTTPPPPVVSSAFESHPSWREALRAAPHGGQHVGTTFGFTLAQAATVDVGLTRQLPGRRISGACVATTKQTRRAAICTRAVHEGVLIWPGHAGANLVPFAGRIPNGRRLSSGSYVATIVARDAAGQASRPIGLAFSILGG
jgi:hypothetical protein